MKTKAKTPPTDRLLSWRLGRDLSQQEAGEVLGCGHRTYASYERGVTLPSIEVAVRIREEAGIAVEDWQT